MSYYQANTNSKITIAPHCPTPNLPMPSARRVHAGCSYWLLCCLVALMLPYQSMCLAMTVTSSSNIVGADTDYTLTLTNHSKPVTIRTQFGQWTPWQAQPYGSNFQYFLTSGSVSNNLLSCRTRFSNTVIECTAPTPTSALGATIELRITNIKNPSSTKPYPITIIFIYADGSSESVTTSRSVTAIRNDAVSLSGYNSTVGVTSTATSWALTFDYYFDYGTVLRIVYDARLISIGFGGLSGAVASVSNSSNIMTARVSSWSDTGSGLHLVGSISVSNPQASITTTATCTLEFTETGTTYSIQSYTATFTIVPAAYSSIGATTSLQMGLSGQTVSVSSLACPYTPVNLSVNSTSYTDLVFSSSNIITSAAACTGTSTRTCRYNTTSNPKTITPVTQAVSASPVTPLTITTFTYFAPLAAYYPLCSQVYNLQLLPQDLPAANALFNLSRCGAGTTGELNANTNLLVKVEGGAAGDWAKLSLPMGVLAGTWTRVDNSSTGFKYALASADLVNSTHVLIPMPYSNPTFTSSSNSLANITLSRIINSSESIYLRVSPSSLTIPICSTPTASQLSSLSLSLSSTATYSLSTGTLRVRNKFSDYSASDYLRLHFKYYDNVLFLNTPDLAGNLTATLNANATNTTCSITINNNTVIGVYNISRINVGAGGLGSQLYLTIANPATIYPIVSGATGFQLVVTLMTAAGSEKEQATLTFSTPTTPASNSYTPSTLTVVESPALPILRSTNLTLTLSNPLKPKYFASMPASTARISLPFACSQTSSNGSVSVAWQPFQASVTLNLTNCSIGYFNSTSAQLTVVETVGVTNASNSSTSTSTTYPIKLACLDNCLTCDTNKYCTACVNSTFAYFLLYNGQCYSVCPYKTYNISSQSICKDCHASCQACNGSSLVDCTSCPSNFAFKQVNTSTQAGLTVYSNVCVSVCGEGKVLNVATAKCEPCEIDCKYCMSAQYCYFCKDGATQVGNGACDFLICTEPCKSCEGSMANCTACINEKLLYNFECYDTCPANSYPGVADSKNVCLEITSPTLYFPATICSIVLIALVCVCNSCIERGLTADSQRRNINMLSYSSSILAIMELFALFVLLALTFNATSRGLAVAGLVLWLICNVFFGVYYFKVIKNDETVIGIVAKMTSQSKCIYYTIVGFSIGVALRVYRILYCGLFRGVAPYPVKKKNESSILKKRKGSEGRIANQIIANTAEKGQPKKVEPELKETIARNATDGKATSMSNKTVKNNEKKVSNETPEMPNQIVQQSENTSVQSEDQSKFQLKRPYIIYITIGSLLASVLFLAAAISEIVKNAYPGMLFWGLDLLIVSIGSIIVTVLDMWAGVKKSYLMALDKAPVNETMENLRAEEDEATQQKILSNAKITQKLSKNNSPMKKNNEDMKKPPKKKYVPPPNLIRKKSPSPQNREKVLSPQQKAVQEKAKKLKSVKSRYSDLYKRSKKPEESASSSEDPDELPDIKVFEDVEMFTNDDMEPTKKSKKLKPDNKRMSSMQNMRKENKSVLGQGSNAALARGTKANWKLDDIFLGFKDSEDGSEFDKKTIKINAEREIYQMTQKKKEKSEESGEEPASYINTLEREKKEEKEPIEDIEQNQFDLSSKSEKGAEDANLSPQKKPEGEQ